MLSPDGLLDELEAAVSGGSSERRVACLRKVTDLFLDHDGRLTPAQIELFGEVLNHIAGEIEIAARTELSERLAHASQAPTDVVVELANDDAIEVAQPVLTNSLRLDEEAILAIAKSKGQAHLLAISERQSIGSRITDVLVTRGDREVLRTVAGNKGADFSESGFTKLREKASGDDILTETLGTRPDLPAHHLRSLIIGAKDHVRQKLIAAGLANPLDVAGVVGVAAEGVASRLKKRIYDYTAGQRAILGLQKLGRVNLAEVVAMAKAGRYEETACGLTAIAGVPLEVVERLMLDNRVDGLLVLARAVGMDWEGARALIMTRPEAPPASDVALREAKDAFDRLSRQTAQRVIRFWQIRQTMQVEPQRATA